jgi:predicted signal transduction protein with EAL and GGDEF domain
VIGMAKALGIVTVAEGVESEEQVEHLRAMNCDLAQGYYFSHPQPPDVISHLLEGNTNKQEWRPPPKTDDDGAHLESAPAVILDPTTAVADDPQTARFR